MKVVWSMVGAAVLSWLAATALLGTHTSFEVFLGMVAPLAVATSTWLAIERTYRRHPERVTSLMVAVFGGKMLFFGVYVTVILRLPSLRQVPFVVSFASYFIALHVIEAFSLQRLFVGGRQAEYSDRT